MEYQQVNAQNNEPTLKDFVLKSKDTYYYVTKRWKIILFAALIGGAIGFLKAYYKKPEYTAALSYIMEGGAGSKANSLGGLASQFGVNFGGGGGEEAIFDMNTLNELFKSRSILQRVLLNPVNINNQQTSLAEYYITYNKFREKEPIIYTKDITFPANSDPEKFSRRHNTIMSGLIQSLAANNINIKPKSKSNIYEITVKSEDEVFSKLLLESLVVEVSEFYAESKTRKAKKNVDLLKKQADSVRNELNYAIGAVAYATDNIYNLNSALNVQKVPSSKKQIDVQANTSILTQLVQNLEVAKMTLLQETPLIKILDRPVFPLNVQQSSKVRSMITYGILFIFLAIIILILRKTLSALLKVD